MNVGELCSQFLNAVADGEHPDRAFRSAIGPEIEERDREIERLKGCILNGFDVPRVVEWMQTEGRRRPDMAFTAGGERQAAYLVEMEKNDHASRIASLEQQVAELQRDAERYRELRRSWCDEIGIPESEFDARTEAGLAGRTNSDV